MSYLQTLLTILQAHQAHPFLIPYTAYLQMISPISALLSYVRMSDGITYTIVLHIPPHYCIANKDIHRGYYIFPCEYITTGGVILANELRRFIRWHGNERKRPSSTDAKLWSTMADSNYRDSITSLSGAIGSTDRVVLAWDTSPLDIASLRPMH